MIRHLSEEEICRAITGQSTLDEQRHLRTCLACGAELSRWRHTLAAFRHDARARAERTTPGAWSATDWAGTDGRNAPTLRKTRREPLPRLTRAAFAPMWGIAATLLVAAVALVWQVQRNADTWQAKELPRRVIGTGQVLTMTDATADSANEFFPLEYSTVPITHGRVVRIEVPRTAPELFGIDPASLVNASRGTVVADVVVGEDGLARAVRFVRLQTSLTKE